jgi:hypothetical protein
VEQVLLPLLVPSRRAEAAEGLASHQRAGDAAVEIEVAHAELAAGALQVRGLAAEDAAGELVDRARPTAVGSKILHHHV